MKSILKLLRVKHYIKNVLVFVPLAFSGNFFNPSQFLCVAVGFASFCLISSCIYIINDARDIENDRAHPTKSNRPMANGAISLHTGILCAAICLVISVGASLRLVFSCGTGIITLGWLIMYFALNLAYSLGLKNIPIIDVVILMSGFLIRILYGAQVAGTSVSSWLYLTVMSGAFYFALGKRRNEILRTQPVNDTNIQKNEMKTKKKGGGYNTRHVLALYSYGFLDKFMYVCLGMANIFYALWAKEYPKHFMVLTVPLVVVICMQYSLDIEGDSDGDPVEVVLKDKKLVCFCAIFVAMTTWILYAP